MLSFAARGGYQTTMTPSEDRPALCLAGLRLSRGWTVTELMHRPPSATGGRFSVGYRVRHDDGREAYLKALDFSAALQDPDWTRRIQEMTTLYNFERDILTVCRDAGMARVATALTDGSVAVPGWPELVGNVVYIVFELASGDIRSHRDSLADFDLAWCLRSLHHTTVGLSQLHRQGIAHQDLKPSNVLSFGDRGCKVADLGRASRVDIPSEMDSAPIPGDFGYAPPEQLYGYQFSTEFDRRYAADMYHLGSLIFFHFGNVSATATMNAIVANSVGQRSYKSDFAQDIPYWETAFHQALEDLRRDTIMIAKDLTDEVIQIARWLCEPDPMKRGHPKNKLQGFGQYGLDRIISWFDRLATRAELAIR